MISVSLFLGFSHLNSIFWVFVTFPVFFMKYKYETPQKMIADITYTVDVCWYHLYSWCLLISLAQLMFADITCSVDVFWHHLLSWCLLISLAQLMFADITCTVNHCDYFFSQTSPLGKYRRFKLNIYSSFLCTTCFDPLALITCWHWLGRFSANLTESEWSLPKSKF